MTEVENAIFDLLDADVSLTALAPGGVHLAAGGPKAVYPIVIFHMQAHSDENTLKARAFESMLYVVKAVNKTLDPGSALTAQQAADRIDALLAPPPDYHVTLDLGAGFTNMICQREGRLLMPPEFDNDDVYHQRGGMYRIMAAPV